MDGLLPGTYQSPARYVLVNYDSFEKPRKKWNSPLEIFEQRKRKCLSCPLVCTCKYKSGSGTHDVCSAKTYRSQLDTEPVRTKRCLCPCRDKQGEPHLVLQGIADLNVLLKKKVSERSSTEVSVLPFAATVMKLLYGPFA